MNFYFPTLFLRPAFDGSKANQNSYCLARRLWQTTTFDLATLATRHVLHLPYQAMEVFLSQCNLEVCVSDQPSLEAAIAAFQALRLALYTEGISPFLSPFVSTCSVNEYSGINGRDSDFLREDLPEGLRSGPNSNDITVEAWPFELSFNCVINASNVELTLEKFVAATVKVETWRRLTLNTPALRVVESVAMAAPKITPPGQSLLHIWGGLEALFPSVSTELSFKIALYLAQLIAANNERIALFDRIRTAYTLRSAIAHGSRQDVAMEEWQDTWSLLVEAINAVLARGGVPKEKDLLSELLA
jgi:hypothetical protein